MPAKSPGCYGGRIAALLGALTAGTAVAATEAQLGRAHAINYVHELMEAAPQEGYRKVAPDTDMNPFTIRAALRVMLDEASGPFSHRLLFVMADGSRVVARAKHQPQQGA